MNALTFSHPGHPLPTLHDLPHSEHPVHRICEFGPNACSTVELLAALIGGRDALNLAHQVLARCDTVADLRTLADGELLSIRGLGPVTVSRLTAAVELGNRVLATLPPERRCITCPADAARLLMPGMAGLEQEHLRVILLDTRNRVITVTELYKGSLDASLVRVGEIFREAIRRNAAGVIVAHNHPSGNPSPSPEDVSLTRVILEAGKLLDVPLLDRAP